MWMQTDGSLYAEAGNSLAKVSQFAQANGRAGLEFASGIPGTLGGAVYMNAGAYGGEIKDVIREALVLDDQLAALQAGFHATVRELQLLRFFQLCRR